MIARPTTLAALTASEGIAAVRGGRSIHAAGSMRCWPAPGPVTPASMPGRRPRMSAQNDLRALRPSTLCCRSSVCQSA